MTIARGLAIAALIVAVIAVAVLMFGSGGGETYTVRLETANQLVKGNEVKVGGLAVGEITDITLSDDNQADIKITVNDEFAPLHEGTTAVVRVTSLPSVANRYIALTPGPNNAPELPGEGVIELDKSTNAVDLDQLFNTLDKDTRAGLQRFVKGSAEQIDGRSKEGSESLHYLNPALSTSSQLIDEIVADKQTFSDFVSDTSQVVNAIAERRNDLADLVGNANATSAAIGDENVALARSLDLLPDTLRNANTTFVNLRATLDDLDVLVAESKPATKDLAPFLRELRPLLAESVPTIRDRKSVV